MEEELDIKIQSVNIDEDVGSEPLAKKKKTKKNSDENLSKKEKLENLKKQQEEIFEKKQKEFEKKQKEFEKKQKEIEEYREKLNTTKQQLQEEIFNEFNEILLKTLDMSIEEIDLERLEQVLISCNIKQSYEVFDVTTCNYS